MWIILSAIIIPPLGLLLLNLLNQRGNANLSAPLVEELRHGLPQYEVEGIEGKGLFAAILQKTTHRSGQQGRVGVAHQ